MYYYSPTSEPASERFLLIRLEDVKQYGGDYGHIVAHVIRKSMGTTTDPDTGSTRYGDSDNQGYRFATWLSGKENALYVEDLRLYSQFDTNNNKHGVYAMRLEFRPHTVEANDAERMLKTFKAIAKKQDKLNDELGFAKDYADHAIRLASALGIKKFVVSRKGRAGVGLGSDDLIVVRAADVRWYVEQMTAQYWEPQQA